MISNVEQGSTEWHALRAGVPTASNFGKIVTSTGAPSKSAGDYVNQLIGEKLLGKTEEGFKTEWMQRGTELESEAREMYEFTQDVTVDQVGFIGKESPACGCSPDGLVGETGGLEIKCPKLQTHIKYLLYGKLPSEYHRQVHGSLYVTGREWWDFMSYYPGLQPFIIRVFPDEKFNDELEKNIIFINEKINAGYQTLKAS